MIIKSSLQIFPRLVGYKLARHRLINPPGPLILNYSITNKCQSRCATCNIWKLYKENPKKEKEELKLPEIERIFKSMPPVFLLNICGGEPFLREDLGEICKLAAKYIKPKVIHSPTNCLAPESIERITGDILSKIPKSTSLTIKLSMDGIGEKHDKIRGIKGNFEKVIDTHNRLIKVRESHPNLYIDAGTTVSKMNLKDLNEIQDYAEKHFKLDNFLHEIADTRAELFNINSKEPVNEDFKKVVKDLGVTPTGQEYSEIADTLCERVMQDMKTRRKLSKITQSLRIVYYKRAAKVMKEGKRKVACYAGISNCHLNPWGDIWICNVQAFNKSMGNLKNYDYNFKKLWNSQNAKEIRNWVNKKECYCPLVGQAFLDTLMSPKELLNVFYYYLKK